MKNFKVYIEREKREDDNPISSTWAYRKKLDAENKITQFKARIFAQGFKQTHGLNFEISFAPTGRPISLRLLLNFAVNNNLKIHQLDVKSAFLTAPINEKVTLFPPKVYPCAPNTVFELKNAIYGLKQASLMWYQRLKEFLIKINFKASVADPCVFWRINQKEESTYIYAHVDDLVIISKKPEIFKAEIEGEFQVKYLGEAQFLLGMNLIKNENELLINQKQYIERKLIEFELENSIIAKTPVLLKNQLEKSSDEEHEEFLKTKKDFRSIVVSLNYLSVLTRPDISYSVSLLSQFLEKPSLKHYNAAIRVFQY
jgi:hypothetical protein